MYHHISVVSWLRRFMLTLLDQHVYFSWWWQRTREKINKSAQGFPGGASGTEPACQCRRHKRHRFNPLVRKITWRRAWQPTSVFLLRGSHGQRSLVGYSHRESYRVGYNWSNFACTNSGLDGDLINLGSLGVGPSNLHFNNLFRWSCSGLKFGNHWSMPEDVHFLIFFFSVKDKVSNYFRLWEPYSSCCNYFSALPLWPESNHRQQCAKSYKKQADLAFRL